MKSEEILKAIGVREVTTRKQKANGTRMFLYPQKEMHNSGHTEDIRFAVYETGYVRRVTNGHAANYYLNLRYNSNRAWYNEQKKKSIIIGSKKPCLIPIEQDRIDYLCSYILRNYVSKQSKYLIDESARSCIANNRLRLSKLI